MIRFDFSEPAGDYLGRLSRLRWRRAFQAADGRLSGTLEVREEKAIAVPGSAAALFAAAERCPGSTVYPLESGAGWQPPAASTLRELEEACPPIAGEARPLPTEPVSWAARFVPDAADRRSAVASAGFRVVRFSPSFGARQEIVSRIPPATRRLLDVGCGTGETAAAAKRTTGARVEGIERDRRLAEAARPRLDAVHDGDALDVLCAIAARGEEFDAFLFADVLEHCRDPHAVLDAARGVASPGATVIVSVPNAAGAPILADLVAGRFDPVPAGPEDAGHLRWFTRRTLRELLDETGFSVVAIDPLPLPRDDGFGRRLAAAGVAFDPEELGAIQWVATARS